MESERLILMARSLGFGRVGITTLDGDALTEAMSHYRGWIAQGCAGDMEYLARHAGLRADPAQLLDQAGGQVRAIAVTMDYLPGPSLAGWRQEHDAAIADPGRAVTSVYAHGRDYHKVMRQRLVQLAEQLQQDVAEPYRFRACVDSAPVLEVEIARRCGLGWRGKHTLLLNRTQGSMFFLGILLTDMPLPEITYPAVPPESMHGHCGTCTACLDACPTQAFVAPAQLDARRCISYLTIEHRGDIAPDLAPRIGNRIYGCDDCQQVCPWNQYAQAATVDDFDVRNGLDRAHLADLLDWTEAEFLSRFEGSAIRRIGHERWLRNIILAAGNSLRRADCSGALRQRLLAALHPLIRHPSSLVRGQVQWAMAQAGVDPATSHANEHGQAGEKD